MSRQGTHSPSLRRRPSRTLPAAVVAMVLLILGVAMAWVGGAHLSSGSWPDPVRRSGGRVGELTWGGTPLIATAVVAALLGLVLIYLAVSPGKPSALRIDTETLTTDRSSTEAVMTRRSVAKLARSRAHDVDGVQSVTTTVGPRTVSMTVTTNSTQRDQIQKAVTSAVEDSLRSAALVPMPRIVTTVRTRNP